MGFGPLLARVLVVGPLRKLQQAHATSPHTVAHRKWSRIASVPGSELKPLRNSWVWPRALRRPFSGYGKLQHILLYTVSLGNPRARDVL